MEFFSEKDITNGELIIIHSAGSAGLPREMKRLDAQR